MINMALLRPHGMAGVTLIGKNHFGSVHFPNDGGWPPRALHNHVLRTSPMGSYNALVDLMGHRHLGGKTMLYILDGLYTAEHNEGNVFRWASFNDHWASSMLMSQDPVAIDSVGLDILRSEPRATQVRGNADNYLHEAAQAAKPPSGTVVRSGRQRRAGQPGRARALEQRHRAEVLAQPGPQGRHRADRFRLTGCRGVYRDMPRRAVRAR